MAETTEPGAMNCAGSSNTVSAPSRSNSAGGIGLGAISDECRSSFEGVLEPQLQRGQLARFDRDPKLVQRAVALRLADCQGRRIAGFARWSLIERQPPDQCCLIEVRDRILKCIDRLSKLVRRLRDRKHSGSYRISRNGEERLMIS